MTLPDTPTHVRLLFSFVDDAIAEHDADVRPLINGLIVSGRYRVHAEVTDDAVYYLFQVNPRDDEWVGLCRIHYRLLGLPESMVAEEREYTAMQRLAGKPTPDDVSEIADSPP